MSRWHHENRKNTDKGPHDNFVCRSRQGGCGGPPPGPGGWPGRPPLVRRGGCVHPVPPKMQSPLPPRDERGMHRPPGALTQGWGGFTTPPSGRERGQSHPGPCARCSAAAGDRAREVIPNAGPGSAGAGRPSGCVSVRSDGPPVGREEAAHPVRAAVAQPRAGDRTPGGMPARRSSGARAGRRRSNGERGRLNPIRLCRRQRSGRAGRDVAFDGRAGEGALRQGTV